MYLAFANTCIVKIKNLPNNIKDYLIEENISLHSVPNDSFTPNIVVDFVDPYPKEIKQLLHPNAFVSQKGFAFHDANNYAIHPDYSFEPNANIVAEKGISPIIFWDVLFDHIKLYLLKNKIVTLHAAGINENGKVSLFFGWDGSGKSSILLENLQNNKLFMGDDRIFFSSEGNVYPFFNPIKQFYHELKYYPKFMKNLNPSKRFFIKISQKINDIDPKHKFYKKLGAIALKVFRKLKLNYVTINVNKFSGVDTAPGKLNQIFYVNKSSGASDLDSHITDFTSKIAANVVYADIQTLNRYYCALFSGETQEIDQFENMYENVFKIINNIIADFKINVIQIDDDTSIENTI